MSDLFRVGFSADFMTESGSLVFPDLGLSLLDGVPGLSYEFIKEYRPAYLPEQLRNYDVVISLKPHVTAESLVGVDRLCAIGRCGVGYDNVDLVAARQRGITVTNTPGVGAASVAELTLGLMLAVTRAISGWEPSPETGSSAPSGWETLQVRRSGFCVRSGPRDSWPLIRTPPEQKRKNSAWK